MQAIRSAIGMSRGAATGRLSASSMITSASSSSRRNYETLAVKTVAPYVTHVEINRPDKLNAMNIPFWK